MVIRRGSATLAPVDLPPELDRALPASDDGLGDDLDRAEPDQETAVDPATQPGRVRARYISAFLDALIPGLGHLILGRRMRALIFVAPLLLGLATSAWLVATTSSARLAASLLSNEVIWGLLAAQALLLASRLLAVGSSLLNPELPRPGRRDLIPIAILLVFVVA